MEKNFKKTFEKEVYLRLRREITWAGMAFILIGIIILICEYFNNSSSIALAIIFIAIGLIFFFRRYMFDKGFASKGDPVNRFNLNLALQERLRRFKLLQEIHYSFKRARRIILINKWLEES
jgi:hypothetical protein